MIFIFILLSLWYYLIIFMIIIIIDKRYIQSTIKIDEIDFVRVFSVCMKTEHNINLGKSKQ